MNISWTLILQFGNLAVGGGLIALLFRMNYTWNTVLDRVDLLYKAYCDEHTIPFKGLKNDFE